MAAAVLLVRHVGAPTDSSALGELIQLAHPAWNSPPIWGLEIKNQRAFHDSVASFAIVACFSAFDDFIVGTEAELSRVGESAAGKVGQSGKGECCPKERSADDNEDDEAERFFNLYKRHEWSVAGIEEWKPVLRYFRLIRNSIAHRASRASKALAEHSVSEELKNRLANLLDASANGFPIPLQDDHLSLDPTLAILCSHVLRQLAQDANRRLVESLGEGGFLRSVAHHTMLGDKVVRSPYAYRSAEAVLNAALTERYRVRVQNKTDAIEAMARHGLWRDYVRAFETKP